MTKKELLHTIRSLANRIRDGVESDSFPEKDVWNDLQQLNEYLVLYKHADSFRTENENQHPSSNGKNGKGNPDLFSSVPDPAPAEKEIKPEPVITQPAELRPEKNYGDVSESIGINDKFRFINELFQGNAKEYAAVIEQLNAIQSPDEAEAFLNSIRAIYEWKDDNAAVEEFVETVQRRYA